MIKTFECAVRSANGTYLTSRVEGKSSSCTAGPKHAAQALGAKLSGCKVVHAVLLAVDAVDHNRTTWRVHCVPSRVADASLQEDQLVSWPAVRRTITSKAAKRNPAIAVAAWNNAYSVGQVVDYRSDPHAKPLRFKTRCSAEVLSGHTAVVWLEGKSGCVTLESLVPVAGGAEA